MTRSRISSAVATGYAVSPPNMRMSPRGAAQSFIGFCGFGNVIFLRTRRGPRRGSPPRRPPCRRCSRSRRRARARSRERRARNRRTEESRGAFDERLRLVRRHPVSRIDVFRRDGTRHEVPKMTPERSNAEPGNSVRMFATAPEHVNDASPERLRSRRTTGTRQRLSAVPVIAVRRG